MLKYVVEEVDRVKGLFEEKEQRLIGERDDARKEAAASIGAARSEAASAAARATDLEARLGTYPQQLEVLLLAAQKCLSYLQYLLLNSPPRSLIPLHSRAYILLGTMFSTSL